jgi:hypothetical protein
MHSAVIGYCAKRCSHMYTYMYTYIYTHKHTKHDNINQYLHVCTKPQGSRRKHRTSDAKDSITYNTHTTRTQHTRWSSIPSHTSHTHRRRHVEDKKTSRLHSCCSNHLLHHMHALTHTHAYVHKQSPTQHRRWTSSSTPRLSIYTYSYTYTYTYTYT